MIIDASYFIGEINIPNSSSPEVEQLLNVFINKYEPKLLRHLLGSQFYAAFLAGIAVTDPVSTPNQRWLDLRDGNGDWQGIITSDPKESFIANYVYYWWSANNITQSSAMGEVSTANENAVPTSPEEKVARAWNEMFEWICKMRVFLEANKNTYPEYQAYEGRRGAIKAYNRVNTFGI